MKTFAMMVMLAAVLAASSIARAATPLGPGQWGTANGNTLTIESIDATSGMIAGRFVAAVAQTPECKAGGHEQREVGWYNRESHVIAFSISVPQQGCSAVVSWSGHYDEDTQEILTQWMRTSGTNGATTMLGTARFTRQR